MAAVVANPVSKTAYYCTGVRMLDAQSADPLVGDVWAERFMDDEARAFFERFRSFSVPNASNVVRHHLVDEVLRSRLAHDPHRRIVLLGCGFDARALRFRGGEWIEVDEAPIIERKNRLAPAAAAGNPLTRIAIDFARDSLADTLGPHSTDAPMTVVIEGVLYYLEAPAIEQTLGILRQLFPRHELICDLQSDAFVRRYARRLIERIEEHGARWRFHPAHPVAAMEALGYKVESTASIALRTAELGRISTPAWVVRWLLPSLRDGYQVCVFSPR
jgi:methyltransferase (TIGR00027 family)